jgi:hypothetical protein
MMGDGGWLMLSKPACPVGRAKSASGGAEVRWLMVFVIDVGNLEFNIGLNFWLLVG